MKILNVVVPRIVCRKVLSKWCFISAEKATKKNQRAESWKNKIGFDQQFLSWSIPKVKNSNFIEIEKAWAVLYHIF